MAPGVKGIKQSPKVPGAIKCKYPGVSTGWLCNAVFMGSNTANKINMQQQRMTLTRDTMERVLEQN